MMSFDEHLENLKEKFPECNWDEIIPSSITVKKSGNFYAVKFIYEMMKFEEENKV